MINSTRSTIYLAKTTSLRTLLRLGKVGNVLQLSIIGPLRLHFLGIFPPFAQSTFPQNSELSPAGSGHCVVELPEAASAESKKAPENITALSGPFIDSSTVMAAVLTRPSSLQTGSDAPVKYDAAQLKLLSLVV